MALDGALNLDDGLHPNTKGVAEITKRILPSVEELIARVRATAARGLQGLGHAAAVHGARNTARGAERGCR